MKAGPFEDYNQMLAECDQLISEDVEDAEDRVTISSFYNGRDTMTKREQESSGTENIVNHLLGYDSINLAKQQIEAINTKPKNVFEIDLYDVPQNEKHRWEQVLTENFNMIIKNSRRFKPEWKGVAGEITLFGRGTLIHRDNNDWCPTLATPYVPRGTGILPNEIPYMMIPDYLTIIDLKQALKASNERKDLGMDVEWNLPALQTAIDMLESNLTDKTKAGFVQNNKNITKEEEFEQNASSSTGHTATRQRIAVYYLYIGDFDCDDCVPFDLVVLPRFTLEESNSINKSTSDMPEWLFHGTKQFERAGHLVHPMFIDCQIGGKMNWHRVMGLGRLNYEPDVEIEEFFNEAMAGSRENIRRVYQVASAADWELLKTWADSGSSTNVLPPGVTVADMGRQPNFQHSFHTIEMLTQLTRRNAAGSINHPDSGKVKELEVNALERQGRNAEALSTRMSDIYECADALGIEMFRRMLAEDPLPCDQGYAEIKAFQDICKKYKIPLNKLRKMKDGKAVHWCVRSSRSAGDGNTVKRRMVNQMLMSRLNLFNSEAQQIILRRVTAEESGDYEFAEQIVPYKRKDDPDQVNRANQENDTMDKRGILGQPVPTNEDDLDMVHIQQHMADMQADLARAKVRPWDEIDLAAFKAKGGHTMMHIEHMKGIKEQKPLVNKITQELQQLAKAGQEHANNIAKAAEAKKQEMSQKEQVEMQIKARKQALAEHAQTALEDHREKSLSLATQKAKVSAEVQVANSRVGEQASAHQQMLAERSAQEDAAAMEADKAAQFMEAQNPPPVAAPAGAAPAQAEAPEEPAPSFPGID
jgi:hypothetical protein